MQRLIQNHRLSAIAAAIFTVTAVIAPSARADTLIWKGTTTNAAGNLAFNDSTNWTITGSNLTPTVTDTAVFDNTGAYPATGKAIASITGNTYGIIEFDRSPAFTIGTNNNAFGITGIGGIGFIQTAATTTSQTILNGLTLNSSSIGFDIEGSASLIERGGIVDGTAISGKIVKSGVGTLVLNAQSGATSTYTGGTLVSAGQLTVTGNVSTLGTGGVEVSPGAILELDKNTYIADGAALTLDQSTINGRVNLAFDGSLSEAVGSLTLGGVTYTSGTFNAASNPDYFIGTGNIVVGTPEPAMLGALALAGGAALRRRRR